MFLKQNFLLGLVIITRSINESLAELVGGYPLSSTVLRYSNTLARLPIGGPSRFCEFTKNRSRESPTGLAPLKFAVFNTRLFVTNILTIKTLIDILLFKDTINGSKSKIKFHFYKIKLHSYMRLLSVLLRNFVHG